MALDPKLKDAVSHLQSHADGMRAVLTVADAITDIGALEQLASEAESRKAAAYVDVDEVNKKLEAAKGDLDKANASVADAQKQAADIIADARAQAAGIVNDAKDQAKAAAASIAAQADAELSVTRSKIASAKDDLASVNADINTAQAEVDSLTLQAADLEGRVASAKAFLQNLKV